MTIDYKELARVILQGWANRTNLPRKEDEPEVLLEEVYEKLTGSEDSAVMLSLFSYWSNDLISLFSTSPLFG